MNLQQPRSRLSARAVVFIVVHADAHFVDRQLPREPRVHQVEHRWRERAASDLGLIRDDHQPKPRTAQAQQGVANAR